MCVMKRVVLLFILVGAFSAHISLAQESVNTGYNPNSVYPIHEDDIMFKKRVWRRMDLNEKQNKPFFANKNEITKIILNAAKAGIIPIYKNDSCTTRYTKEEFLSNLENPQLKDVNGGGQDDAWGDSGGGSGGDDWGSDDSWGGEDDAAGAGSADIGPIDTKFSNKDVSILELVEDMIFDKKRSVMVWDMQAIKLIIPAEKFTAGIFREVGVFKYKDLEKLFRSMPDEAIWFNPQNSAAHKNLADAFALRLFSARITKVANPDDNAVIDIYSESPRQGILASKWMEYELMEKEHELWSY
ncbi:MAG: hypothetical protein ACJAT1_000032 [Marivirga sp.]|jgi:hypothetical protein